MATNTVNSFTDHTGNGSAGPFNVSFSYLSEAEVDVTVGGAAKTLGTHYTFTSATQITFTSGNEPSNFVAIKFQRNTNVSSKAVDFNDGSVLTEVDLDNQSDQILFSMQEIVDSGAGNNVSSVTGSSPISSSGGRTPAISISAATTSAAGSMSASDKSKLDGIEASATADQSASEIRTLVNNASDSNVFTDADHTKLDGIEASATADQTNAEIKTAYEANSDTNAFTDAEKTKLNAVENNATADQTNAEIKTAYEANSDTNAFTDAEKTKLSGVEASADVTDATNVNAAGAVMNSDLDVKGELLVGDGSGDPSALSVGTNGYVLKANSSTTTGLEWAAESGGGSGEANQNAFTTIAVSGQSNVVADSTTDTLNLAAGSNVSITTNASSDTITISSTGGGGGSGISNVVEDSSPQLGGNLDVQAREITTSTANGNIVLNPNGEFGVVRIKGDSTNTVDGTLELRCSSDSHGVKIKSPPHSAAQNYTLTLPSSIVNGAFLKTDSNGGLSFATPTDTNTQLSNAEVRTAVEAASDSNVFTDADHTKLDGLVSNATHTGEVTGSTALTIADNVVDEANLKVSNTPTNGYVLTAQSGDTGGLTWAAASGGGGLSSDSQYNTVGGTNAGDSFTGTDANYNTLIGYNAGTAITTADYNTLIGAQVGINLTEGINNTAVGYESIRNVTTGRENTTIGRAAGYSLTTGMENTLIGYKAGMNATTGENIICIGYESAPSSNTVSDEITLGDSNITKFRIPGLDGFEIDDNGTIDLPGAINETIFAITDASSVALDPDNGMVQTWTLGWNRTATDSLTTGQSMLLIVTTTASNYTLTWPTMKWSGGSAPTLGGANATAIELFKVGSQLYGATVGDLS